MGQTVSYNPALSGNPQSATNAAYPNGNPNAPLNPAGSRNTDSCLPLHAAGEVTHDYRCDGPAPGNLAFRWMYGTPIAARNRNPRVQVIAYNEDTYLMRQNICVHWEGPFTYLLFGNEGALLIDTGATPEGQYYPLRTTVDAIIARWAKLRRKNVVPLTIAFTSGEDIAQNQGVGQFLDREHTAVIPRSNPAMKEHYRFTSWPAGAAIIELGDRVVTVIPTPGTHKDGLSFYDPYCDFLFTGDLVYPGKIQIGNERDFVASLERLQAFKNTHPVKWVMGGHIEMQFVPGKAYPRFYTYKPYERVLEMKPELIDEVLQYGREMQGKQTIVVRPDFQLFNGVSPDARTTSFPDGVTNIAAPRPF